MIPLPRAALVGAVVVLLGALPACGTNDGTDAGPGSAYCRTVKRDQSVFSDDGTGLVLVTNLAKLKQMAAAAPDDLQDEWQTFLDALEGLRSAISSVGLKPSDFVNGLPPAQISAKDRATIATAADRLSQADVVDAGTGIEQQAKDVCKLQLGL